MASTREQLDDPLFSYSAYCDIARRKFAGVIPREFCKFMLARSTAQSRRYVFERLGRIAAPAPPNAAAGTHSIWIHANSLGEVYAACGLIRRIREQYPGSQIWVSTGNSSADTLAREVTHADRVIFVPYDLSLTTRSVVRCVRPVALIIVESSIWPTLVRSCRAAGAAVIVVSGRSSEGRMQFYERHFRYSPEFFEGIDRFCLQSEAELERLAPYLSDPGRAVVTGNLKFGTQDVRSESTVRQWGQWSSRLLGLSEDERVWVAGSVHEGEEVPILAAFIALRIQDPRALLVVAPRYRDAVPVFEAEALRSGLKVVRRSQLDSRPRRGEEVVIVDTYGELRQFYACASWVFLGNSLTTPGGGQNLIEPAVCARPVMFGPHMENFQCQVDQFLAVEAAVQVTVSTLATELLALAADEPRATDLGRRAKLLVGSQADVVERTFDAIATFLDPENPARAAS